MPTEEDELPLYPGSDRDGKVIWWFSCGKSNTATIATQTSPIRLVTRLIPQDLFFFLLLFFCTFAELIFSPPGGISSWVGASCGAIFGGIFQCGAGWGGYSVAPVGRV
jgi:hypothetical protein